MSDKKPTIKKRKSSKKNKIGASILGVIILLMIVFVFVAAGAGIGIVLGIIKDADPIDVSSIYDLLDENSFILDANGEVIEKVQREGFRTVVEYYQFPKHLVDAFVAIEDERFWSHNGIDLKRIFGAAWTNFRTGSKQGASTINQQLAKNLFLTKEQTYTRKIQDAYYGIQLDKRLSKPQILEAYLNTIYLGSSANGVQAAAQVYFSKDVQELTIAEAALIAGVTRNPSRYSPIRTLEKHHVENHHYIISDPADSIYTIVFNENTIPRQRLVLSIMKRLGYISNREYEDAIAEDVKANLRPNRLNNDEISSYFADLVKKDLINTLEDHGYSREDARNLLYSGGLRIYSTMDMNIQRILEEEYENPDNFPGTLKDAEGNFLRDAEGNVQPQAAMVIMNYRTGEIKGLVGGRMISGQKIFNRALSPRQPGSAIKPIAVYTPAIDKGFTAASVIDDVPIYFNKNTPNKPWPVNFYGRVQYYGLMTIREAIEQSSNVVAVKTASMLGADDASSFYTMFEYMEKMGISSFVRASNPYVAPDGRRYSDETYSTALGGMTHGVSALEMAAAYGSIANEGMYIKPITFTKIVDRHGNILLENKPLKRRVLTPQGAYVMTDMLKTAVSRGTGSRARLNDGNSQIPVAGKTGTTNDRKDAWFVGYTPYYVASTWIGFDLPEKLSDGSRMAAILWKNIMSRIHEDYSPRDFTMPNDIVRVNICTKSGKLVSNLCSLDPRGNSVIRSEIFVTGTEPKEVCDVHVSTNIHVPTGRLATEHTPSWEVQSRVFVRRPIPYSTQQNSGITPLDYSYELPRQYYDPLTDWLGGTQFLNNPQNDEDNQEQDHDLNQDSEQIPEPEQEEIIDSQD